MRSLTTFVLFLGFLLNIEAQDLVFELSIKWEKTKQPLRFFKSEHKTPYLIIVMRNLGDDKIYFKNPFLGINNIPSFINLLYPKSFIREDSELTKLYKINNGQYFYLIMGSSSGGFVDILNKELKEKYDSEAPGEFGYTSAGLKLCLFYDLFRLQSYLNTHQVKKQSRLFEYKNTYTMSWNEVREKISEMYQIDYDTIYFKKSWFKDSDFFTSSKRFVFLSPGESKDIKFNLLGFKILGGSYEFLIGDKDIENYVYTIGESKNNRGAKLFSKKFFLPKKVKGYKLYVGKFISNKLIVNFDN